MYIVSYVRMAINKAFITINDILSDMSIFSSVFRVWRSAVNIPADLRDRCGQPLDDNIETNGGAWYERVVQRVRLYCPIKQGPRPLLGRGHSHLGSSPSLYHYLFILT